MALVCSPSRPPSCAPRLPQSSLMGASLTLPVQHGRLALGTWQGIYLNEHRNYGGPRRLVITVQVGCRVAAQSVGCIDAAGYPSCAQGSIPHWQMEAERLSGCQAAVLPSKVSAPV